MSHKLHYSRVSEWRGQMALKDLANLLCSDEDTSGVFILAAPALNLDFDDDDDLDGLFDSHEAQPGHTSSETSLSQLA